MRRGRALRQGRFLESGQKVLLVLDQFEQWLHARRDEENAELVQALRQCDGGRVQCVVLVRDDFWMAVTRFLMELEVDLVQGRNAAAVDLFPLRHAERVLAAFGRAFGALPEEASKTTRQQQEFLNQAVAGLSQEHKVICVRLALFAEMLKGRPWTPATLKEVGGTAGVGVTFLEDTFSSPTANPKHRLHQKAARAVLQALLPEAGTDIKGTMRSHAELLAASGYANRPREFDDLLRILDGELRLVTPTDPEGQEDDPQAPSASAGTARYYQLTHDYLVPSLRDWLTRKQKETRRGRAELLLADRAAVWNARPENRQLPSLLQWSNIRWLTRSKDWTPPQRRMMRRATRYHAVRAAALLLMVLLLGWGGYEGYGRLRAEHLVDSLVTADTADVPRLVEQLPGYRRWTDGLLRRHLQNSPPNTKEHLYASLALAAVDQGQVEYLSWRLLLAGPAEVVVIRDTLFPYRDALSEQLWGVLEDRNGDPDQRLRAACVLACFAPDDPRWDKVGGEVAAKLVTENALVLGQWVDALRPVRRVLLPPLATFLEDDKRGAEHRRTIAGFYGTYAADSPGAFAPLEKRLAEESAPDAADDAKLALARRQANIGVALVFMGRGDKVWPLLRHSPDPTRRSYIIDRLGPGGVAPRVLIDRLDGQTELSVRRALLLALGEYDPERLLPAERDRLVGRLAALYRDAPDPGIHGAAGWLLRRWGQQGKVENIDRTLATRKPEGDRQWYVNGQGQTFVIVPRGEFDMGDGPGRKRVRVDHRFALAARDVTVAEFRQFRKDHHYFKEYAPTEDCPVNMVTWYDAAAYCNWLSKQEGIAQDQWCYLPNEKGDYAEGMKLAADWRKRTGYRLAADWRKRTGYRLPTAAEWEYVCRAGSVTHWSMGTAEELLLKYAWTAANYLGRPHPVGLLRPNDLGLFDIHGNVWQWCQDRFAMDDKGLPQAPGDKDDEEYKIDDNSSLLLRGGAFNHYAVDARSAQHYWAGRALRDIHFGFRPARTFR
jgi:formylglycine-generating enzyme required for sulfatase activity